MKKKTRVRQVSTALLGDFYVGMRVVVSTSDDSVPGQYGVITTSEHPEYKFRNWALVLCDDSPRTNGHDDGWWVRKFLLSPEEE